MTLPDTPDIVHERTLVLHPFLYIMKQSDSRTPQRRLEEACGLAEAIRLAIISSLLIPLKRLTPATYLGSGKVAEIGQMVQEQNIGLVVFDGALSPVQQRNLEKAWKCKVIDRTALILEIFGDRAQTKEGTLQVELAALEYQKSRLVRSWTHLERQRGGFGFMGGPGEKQIETDRRIINERITRIKKELEKVKRTRSLHRKSRKSVPYPVVALVGYTNAGKSTLFNRLTGAKVMAKDMLFATLDPTMRVLTLPSKNKIILSDTVGFISDLPTELVAAFHATLEEVIAADLILHIRDASSPEMQAQKADVENVLSGLGLEKKMHHAMLEVWNKTDLLADAPPEGKLNVSALTGYGCERLVVAIDDFLSQGKKAVDLRLPASEGKLLAWIHQHAEQVKSHVEKDHMHITAQLSEKHYAQLQSMMKKAGF